MAGKRKSTEERQEDILEASLAIIHEKGHRALTVRNIADRIGVSEPAVYRHFDNKEEIVRSLTEEVFEKERIKFEEDFESPYKLLRNAVYSLFESLEESPKDTSVLFHGELFNDYPEVKQVFIQHRRQKKQRLETMIRIGQQGDFFSEDVDPEVFATVFMGTVRMSVLEWREEGFSYDLTEKADEVARELSKILES